MVSVDSVSTAKINQALTCHEHAGVSAPPPRLPHQHIRHVSLRFLRRSSIPARGVARYQSFREIGQHERRRIAIRIRRLPAQFRDSDDFFREGLLFPLSIAAGVGRLFHRQMTL